MAVVTHLYDLLGTEHFPEPASLARPSYDAVRGSSSFQSLIYKRLYKAPLLTTWTVSMKVIWRVASVGLVGEDSQVTVFSLEIITT